MSDTRAGGLKAAEKNKSRYGKDFYQVQGRAGGKVKVAKGFSFTNPKEAGRMGGRIGSRSKTKESLEVRRLRAEFQEGFHEPSRWSLIKERMLR